MTQAKGVWCCSQCCAIYRKDYPRCPMDGAEIVMTTGDPLVGTRIDNYVIDELVGEGGMGRVYRSHHANLPGKRYAIKILLGDVAAMTSMRKRFVNEAEIASRLDHPNLVEVVDFGVTPSGLPYIAMNFVEGELLTEILDRAPIDWKRAVRLARALGEGLAYIHDAGFVHRDLKPDNVIIVNTPKGEVPRLTDFGLVMTQAPDPENRLTTTGMAMGTPAYAAPEQLAGKPLDHRADLFSLGMTLYEMLTGGKLPWEGAAMEIAMAKAHRDAASVASRAPEIKIPGELEVLLMHLLARRPTARPDSARHVIALFDQLLDTPSTEPTPILVERRTRWWIPAAMLVVGVAAFGGLWVQSRARREPTAVIAPPPRKLAAAIAAPISPAPHEVEVDAITQVAGREDRVASADSPEPEQPARPTSRPRAKQRQPSHHVAVAKTDPSVARPPNPDPPVVIPPKDPPPPPVEVVPPKDPPPKELPPPPAPVELRASLVGVTVTGSLPEADVERAVRRTMSSIERCMPKQAEHIVAHLKIGESRRAQAVEASGGTASACVAAALGAMRTESAPDVGDVTVIVQVGFVAKP